MDPVLEALEEDRIVNAKDLKEIRRKLQQENDFKISEFLIQKGYFGDISWCEWMHRRFGFKIITDISDVDISLVRIFPHKLIKEAYFVPVRQDEDGKIITASPEPFNLSPKIVEEICGVRETKVMVCPPSLVREVEKIVFDRGRIEGGIGSFIDEILARAIDMRATDIHIIPSERPKIKFRVDGLMRDFMEVSPLIFGIMTNRIKVMSGMDIAEKRLPQDGRFSFIKDKGEFDIRVSTIPTIKGEKTALRILKKKFEATLDKLGMTDEQVEIVRNAVKKSSGFIIVSGPTGSGKTTTVYSIFREIDRKTRNVFSVEDPVEYSMDGVNQIQINEDIGFTFPKALRHILRQDPDVIFIGEIRDPESADIALKSALTGHLVIATVHSKDVASSLVRLMDLGVQKNVLISSINLGISQRLFRVLCRECRGQGCWRCVGGFCGREGVFEVILFDDALKERIRMTNMTETEIRELLMRSGFSLLADQAKRKVAEGKTTQEEISLILTI